ncbi:ATP synthase subunit I [Anaeroselena agilis]|uniref:ATP synthase subunit I n=1 Tax=Anaeroselena agilis TaxID=3063788 RepID=A0ABU3P4Z0_9FIRM|nr:ATP synthase subunit I [Selenomonadales bacterium 4137-cl]
MARKLLLQLSAWAATVVGVLYFTGHGDKIAGFLAGTAISAVYGLLVCYRVRRSASLSPQKAVAYMRTGWLIRLAFIVLALAWSLKVPSLNFGAVVAGLLSLQIIIFVNGFYLVVRHSTAK